MKKMLTILVLVIVTTQTSAQAQGFKVVDPATITKPTILFGEPNGSAVPVRIYIPTGHSLGEYTWPVVTADSDIKTVGIGSGTSWDINTPDKVSFSLPVNWPIQMTAHFESGSDHARMAFFIAKADGVPIWFNMGTFSAPKWDVWLGNNNNVIKNDGSNAIIDFNRSDYIAPPVPTPTPTPGPTPTPSPTPTPTPTPTATPAPTPTPTPSPSPSPTPTPTTTPTPTPTPTVTPTILDQPRERTIVTGRNAAIFVWASGDGALTYQWKKDGHQIAGANDKILGFHNVTSGVSGIYTCVVSIVGGGSVESQPITVRVTTVAGVSDWQYYD